MSAVPVGPSHAAYEIRFQARCGDTTWSFPCDMHGRVDMDLMEERDRNNYLFARAVIGYRFLAPKIVACCIE
jgi:hypothetical protein